MRKPVGIALSSLMLAGAAAAPAAASGGGSDPGIVETVIDISGPGGFDQNPYDFDLLRDALVATGLVDAVAEATDITVFAPKDAAFISLARDLGYEGSDEAGVFAFLAGATGYVSADEPGLLDDVLLYHVAPGALDKKQAQEGAIPTLLEGATLDVNGVTVVDGDPNARDASIVLPDLRLSDGIVHVIDGVLRPIDLPPLAGDDTPEKPEPAPGIVDVVLQVSGASGFDRDRKDYDLLREALVAAGLVDAVADAADITVFAPRDGAFIRLARDLGYEGKDEAGVFAFLAGATGYVSADEPGLLDDVLLYHVAPGRLLSGDLGSSPVATLLEGATFTPDGARLVDGDPNARDPRVRKPFDIEAANGVIHTIDRVLRPVDLPPVTPATVVDVVLAASGDSGFDDARRDYDILREALTAADLVTALATAEDITVFAPRDSAFIRLARDLGYEGKDEAGVFAFLAGVTGYVSADEPGLLDDVLLYHVAPGAQTVRELQGDVKTLLDGASVVVDKRKVVDADTDDADARIRRPANVVTGNGIVHTVDRVLRPIDLP